MVGDSYLIKKTGRILYKSIVELISSQRSEQCLNIFNLFFNTVYTIMSQVLVFNTSVRSVIGVLVLF